jgi:hypothetical protein
MEGYYGVIASVGTFFSTTGEAEFSEALLFGDFNEDPPGEFSSDLEVLAFTLIEAILHFLVHYTTKYLGII